MGSTQRQAGAGPDQHPAGPTPSQRPSAEGCVSFSVVVLVSVGVLAMGLEKPDGSGRVGQGQAHLVLLVHSLGFEQEVRVAHHHHHVLELQARGW